MKIIFLDVDGVLNSSTYINKETYHIKQEKVRFFEKYCRSYWSKYCLDLYLESWF